MLIDVICLLVLVAFFLSGYRRGLLMSLCGLLILVLCCLGAALAQAKFTPQVVAVLEPKITAQVEAQIQAELAANTQQAVDQAEQSELYIGGEQASVGELVGILERFGLDVEQSVTEGTATALEPAIHAAAQAVSAAIVGSLAQLLIFFGTFLILYLVLHSVALAVNVVDYLPVLHTLNRAGGAVFGLAEGVLLLTVVAVVLGKTGLLPQEALSGPLGSLLQQVAERLL